MHYFHTYLSISVLSSHWLEKRKEIQLSFTVKGLSADYCHLQWCNIDSLSAGAIVAFLYVSFNCVSIIHVNELVENMIPFSIRCRFDRKRKSKKDFKCSDFSRETIILIHCGHCYHNTSTAFPVLASSASYWRNILFNAHKIQLLGSYWYLHCMFTS